MIKNDKMYYTAYSSKQINSTERIIKRPKFKRITFVALMFLAIISVSALLINYKSHGKNSVINKVSENFGDVLDAGSDAINSVWDPELASKNDLTSVLVIGLDSRKVTYNGDEFIPLVSKVDGDRNTDTIMQIIYDHKSENVFMISIPRDMGVDVDMECLQMHDRINSVYDRAESAGCKEGGVGVLSEVVEDITGVKVNYYAMITLSAYEEIINTVGDVNETGERGIYMNIEKPLYEAYPNDHDGYDPIYFPAGYQFLTAHESLQYARSRAQTSDFDRARRQQQVIQAVKRRILSTDTFTNPGKVYSLIKTFDRNIKYSDVSVNEIRAAISVISNVDDSHIYNVVLDPEFGGHNNMIKKYVARPGIYFYMSAVDWDICGEDDAFCKVRERVQNIIDNPSLIDDGDFVNATY